MTDDENEPRRKTPASLDLLVVGYGKVPSKSAMHSSGLEVLTVCFRVEKSSGRVVDFDSTAVTGLVRRWLSELLMDRDFSEPVDDVLSTLSSNFLGTASGPMRQAIIDAWRRHEAFRNGTTVE